MGDENCFSGLRFKLMLDSFSKRMLICVHMAMGDEQYTI